ncbi:hypothetical protein [Mesobacillus jeotgali]|uniref:hypothetical protein n=1 Tax=Mesobacillus jeotgali TaxID=129985 RepID=UPI0009A65F2B|nr:hypothetical protein [Mesobacillus jeotgali]
MKEKMVADELQCMFLEGLLPGIEEVWINILSRNLRNGNLTINDLLCSDALPKEKVDEALNRIPSYGWK